MAKTFDINDPRIKTIHHGKITIVLARDRLFGDEPVPLGVDKVSSTLRFMELLRDEAVDRLNPVGIELASIPGDTEMEVNLTEYHGDHKLAFHTISRLAMDLEGVRREEWMVSKMENADFSHWTKYGGEEDDDNPGTSV